jgi:excisionase family DNA binding protein
MNTKLSESDQSPRWASLDAAATHIAVSRKSIRRMISEGKITGYRAGDRLIRVDLNELNALMSPIQTTVHP